MSLSNAVIDAMLAAGCTADRALARPDTAEIDRARPVQPGLAGRAAGRTARRRPPAGRRRPGNLAAPVSGHDRGYRTPACAEHTGGPGLRRRRAQPGLHGRAGARPALHADDHGRLRRTRPGRRSAGFRLAGASARSRPSRLPARRHRRAARDDCRVFLPCLIRPGARLRLARRPDQGVKEEPQPQVVLALGLRMTN